MSPLLGILEVPPQVKTTNYDRRPANSPIPNRISRGFCA
jgi:hypothetical protein